ncbi:MAG: hypothetical protein ABIE47_14020 [Pseudomonadota bacterium]
MRRLLLIGDLIIAAIISVLVAYPHHIYASSKCSLDGSRIQPLYEVIIVLREKSIRRFSSIISSRIWFRENSEKVSAILVTDEATGEKIDAGQAFYVESEVVTTPHTRNSIHVFGQREAAELHALKFSGNLVNNPFKAKERKPVQLAKYTNNATGSSDFVFPSSQKPLFLPGKAILIKEQDFIYLYHNYPSRLTEGYSSPPDKPPKSIP